MAVQIDGNAPYAPFSVIKTVIDRHRQVGLPAITLDVLGRMGVSESLTSRSLQALKLLELVDDDGRPTAEFEAIRKAPTEALGPLLAELIRTMYEPVFAVIDPTTATSQQIADAFRSFKPPGQRERMVTLFTGLMAYAGMIEVAPKRTPGPRPAGASAPRATSNGTRRQAGEASAKDQAVEQPPPPGEHKAPTSTYSRTVLLRPGGTITLSTDYNPLELRGAERAFVNALVDLLDGYEDDSPPGSPASTAPDPSEV